MNKRGTVALVYLMLGVLFFLLGMALAPALTDTTNQARDSDNLDCSNASISNQDKAICYQVDTFPPLFIGILFGFGGLILARLMG